MYDTKEPSTQKLNFSDYRDKVLGCWTGKNIGGTLGAPFEWQREMNDVTFYTQDLKGNPAPNDDLDLQLVWLLAAEEKGLYNINERVLGEYWLTHITGPWNEYGVCKANLRCGLIPPLSGSCNNDQWKWSNGAWIRSEIWACIFPGSPDEACQFAYYDACVDHCGEGILAEVFTASLESAAFAVSDIRELIKIGLSRLPENSRVKRSVTLACECYDKKVEFITAREMIVEASKDLGWFQAPANLGFMVLGLLYGEGDFGRSVCLANNCGDDTDCTAGTVGAILGIIMGRSGIPDKWIEPIGESIQTCSIDTFGQNKFLTYPETLDELTDRVTAQAISAQNENGTLLLFTKENTEISSNYIQSLYSEKAVEKRIWNRSPYKISFDLQFGTIDVEYIDGPSLESGNEKKLVISVRNVHAINLVVKAKFHFPENWQVINSSDVVLNAGCAFIAKANIEVIAQNISGSLYYIPVELFLADRFVPYTINIPFQRKDAVFFNHDSNNQDTEYLDAKDRKISSLK